MSLNDFSISGSRDAKFFKHLFSLKKSDSTTVHETIRMHDNVPFLLLVLVLESQLMSLGGVRDLQLRLVFIVTSSPIF